MLDQRATDRLQTKRCGAVEEKKSVRILLASPRGFCAGVIRAIDAVRDALSKHGAPVYVRRPIVHNREVVCALEAEGAIFVEELDQVPAGAVVLFSAHGIARRIAQHAEARGLVAYDAVCPLVAKVHREVERHSSAGRDIILIGHSTHPEIEGTLGHVSGSRAFVIDSIAGISNLPIEADAPTAYAVQTTYCVEDAEAIVSALRATFSDLVGPPSSDICYATTNRQAAIRRVAREADAVLVVGERFSSNALRLAEVARVECGAVQLIAGPDDIEWPLLPPRGTIGLTSAASTPDSSVEKVLDALGQRYFLTIEESHAMIESTTFKRLALS